MKTFHIQEKSRYRARSHIDTVRRKFKRKGKQNVQPRKYGKRNYVRQNFQPFIAYKPLYSRGKTEKYSARRTESDASNKDENLIFRYEHLFEYPL